MNIKTPLVISLSGLAFACGNKPATETNTVEIKKPNIIYILADDLGYGDLSCYGQEKFKTPYIDQLASEGMRFTQHYAGATVCAPSRSALMTGQHTGHTPIRGNKRMEPEGQYPIADETYTIAEMLKSAGYATGGFGKWGLGFIDNEGSPMKQGFDQFYGYMCQGLGHRYYPRYIWHNETKIELNNIGAPREYAQDSIHKAALQFIRANKDSSFFAFLPYIIPHAELIVPEDAIIQSHRGKYDPEMVKKGRDYDAEKYSPWGYCSVTEGHAVFASMVNRFDNYVGEILALLKELGIDDNTIVMFSSDNGPHLEGGADPDYFNSNGAFKGYKRDLYDGGIREPFIVRWPGVVQANTTSDHVSAFWDILPTFAEIVGLEAPKNIDGISLLPTLLGKEQAQHDYLYWEFHEQGGKQAIRMGKWKGIRLNVKEDPNGPIELYDITTDLGEENNLAAEHPDVVAEIAKLMKSERIESEVFPLIPAE